MINGGPFWFPDTSSYIRGADAAIVALTGSRSEWSDRLVDASARSGSEEPGAAASGDEGTAQLRPTRTVLAGRSIYYGMLVYLPMRVAGPWGAPAVQLLFVAALLMVNCRIVLQSIGTRPRNQLAIIAAIALLTPLSFYACMLMPDVFSGLLIASLATLFLFQHRATLSERTFLLASCALIVTFHTTHMLLLIITSLAAGLLALTRLMPMRRVAVTSAMLLCVGVASEAVFTHAVKMQLGTAPITPPFLSARLIDAGPGYRFLLSECRRNQTKFLLCSYLDRMPQTSDTMLWSEDPRNGIFTAVGPDEKRRLASEDKHFFLSVLAARPLEVIACSFRSMGGQLVSFDLANFQFDGARRAAYSQRIPPTALENLSQTQTYNGTMPLRGPVLITVGMTLACLITSLVLIWGSWRGRWSLSRDALIYAALIFAGVLGNAAICGALSGIHSRYQVRLIWLVPLATGLLANGRRARPDRMSPPSILSPNRAKA